MYSLQNGPSNTAKQESESTLATVPKSTSHARNTISLLPRWVSVQIVHTVAYRLYRLDYLLWGTAQKMEM
jgi:hypothetical protein